MYFCIVSAKSREANWILSCNHWEQDSKLCVLQHLRSEKRHIDFIIIINWNYCESTPLTVDFEMRSIYDDDDDDDYDDDDDDAVHIV